MITLQGYYKEGRLELAGEAPAKQGNVLVIFQDEPTKKEVSSADCALFNKFGGSITGFFDAKPELDANNLMPVSQPRKKKRKAGIWKGLIKIADDFDEPLDDFEEHTCESQPAEKVAESNDWYRKPGLMKGQIVMSDDFDEPLDDFAEYM